MNVISGRKVRAEVEAAAVPPSKGKPSPNSLGTDGGRGQNAVHLAAGDLADLLAGSNLPGHLAQFLGTPNSVPVRQRLEGSGGRELLVMPAVVDGYAGIKMLTVIPQNAETERLVISGLFTLFDFRTGAVLATIDAAELTGWRTAAVSALAALRLARPDAGRLTILGAGHLCTYLAAAHAEVRSLRQITIWARNADRAKRAADRIRERLGTIDIQVCPDLQAAVQGSDIVVAATRSSQPLIQGNWLVPGMHVDLIGGYRPDMREIDDAGIARGRLFVDDRDAVLQEAGDVIDPLKRGVIAPSHILGDLSDLVLKPQIERNETDITIFKSVGTASADLATAITAWRHRLDGGATVPADSGSTVRQTLSAFRKQT